MFLVSTREDACNKLAKYHTTTTSGMIAALDHIIMYILYFVSKMSLHVAISTLYLLKVLVSNNQRPQS